MTESKKGRFRERKPYPEAGKAKVTAPKSEAGPNTHPKSVTQESVTHQPENEKDGPAQRWWKQ